MSEDEEDDGYKICPSCREEYVLHMQRCGACDVDLVFPSSLSDEYGDVAEDLPEAEDLTIIRVAPIAWIRALSEALEDQGVAHRVERAMPEDAPDDQPVDLFGNVNLYGLYVEDEVAEEVRLVDEQIAAMVLDVDVDESDDDDGDDGDDVDVDDVDDVVDDDDDEDFGEDDACPGCGADLSPDDEECPDCGLVFG